MILVRLNVQPDWEVIGFRARREQALNPAHFNTRTACDKPGCTSRSGSRRILRSGIAALHAVRTEFLQCLDSSAVREARRECCQTGWRWRHETACKHLLLGDDFIVETAEEKHVIPYQWPANRSARKLVVEAWNLRQFLERFLRIAEAVEGGIAFGSIHFTMNIIRASLSTDVYNRTGIAPVFRAEVVRYDLIFIDEMWIGKSQTRSANRIVVIVLAIHLLVVVPPSNAVDRKTYAVGIRKTSVSTVRNARNR